MNKKLEGNIWKLFIAEFTQRRYFFPILSIYFLSLPDATAQQIGLWTGIGYLAEFLFEIPSGYLADRLGHKRMLIVSKLAMIAGVLCFILGYPIIFFILGAILVSISFAAQSGTQTAFLHETLVSLKRRKTFAGVNSRIFANARLVSVFLLFLVPLSASMSIRTPLYIGLALDLLGLLAVLLLVNPPVVESASPPRSILNILLRLRGNGFYPVVIYTSAITGFAIAAMSYAYPYLETLGFPIAYLGIVAGLRALGQFVIGHSVARFESKINIKRVFTFDLLLFTAGFGLIAVLNNFYFIALILVIIGSYEVGRSAFIDGYLGKYYAKDDKYLATTLSVKGQTSMLFSFAAAYAIGFVMDYSYKAGFYAMGGLLLLILLLTLPFIENKKRADRS